MFWRNKISKTVILYMTAWSIHYTWCRLSLERNHKEKSLSLTTVCRHCSKWQPNSDCCSFLL